MFYRRFEIFVIGLFVFCVVWDVRFCLGDKVGLFFGVFFGMVF